MDNITRTLKDFFAKRPEIKFAYLFGSRAKGKAGKSSDFDIAVFLDKGALKADYPYGYKAALIGELMALLKTNNIDLVVLNDAPPFLSTQVVRAGTLLFCCDNEAKASFLVSTLQRYDDAKRLLKIQHFYMRQRIVEGRFGL